MNVGAMGRRKNRPTRKKQNILKFNQIILHQAKEFTNEVSFFLLDKNSYSKHKVLASDRLKLALK